MTDVGARTSAIAGVTRSAGADGLAIAPFAVHRVNGVSRDRLAIDLPRTCDLLVRLAGARQKIAGTAGPLSGALHDLVPALDGFQDLRRRVLALRRAVHNGRLRVIDDDVLDELGRWLTPAGAALMARHNAALKNMQALQERFEHAFGEETRAAGLSLRAMLDHPALAAGLAHASPDLLCHLRAGPLAPGSRAARGLLAYASRAAVKTSPFSRLTGIALDRAPASGRSITAVAQQHVRAWLDRLARDEVCALAFEVEPDRSVRNIGGHPYLVESVDRTETELAWRSYTVADARLYADVLSPLARWPRMRVAEFLARLGGTDPFGRYLRLPDTGFVRVVVPWDYADEAPLLALARALEAAGAPRAVAAARALRSLHVRAAALNRDVGRARVEAMRQLLDVAALPPAPGSRPENRPTVYEDAVSDVPVSLPAAPVQADLRELGSLVRPYIFRSHLYDQIISAFTGRFGRGGRCADPFAFLMEQAAHPEFNQRMAAALLSDRGIVGQASARAWLPVSASSAPPATAVLYQISARTGEDVAAGRYQLIVNQYNPGLGGLVARFRNLLDAPAEQSGLTGQLHAWVASAFPGAEAREIALCADINSMQLDASGILPPYPWPGEAPCARTPAHPDGVELRHLAADDTLLLTDRRGIPVAPVYFGIVPAHLMAGVVRLMLCLADPWVNGAYHLACARNPWELLPPPGPGLHEMPRLTHGRLVLKRRTWRLAPAEFPQPAPGEGAPAYFMRMDEWRRAHALPEEVFLTLEQRGWPGGDPADRKPSWLSFRSAHAVLAAAASRRLGQARALRLTEALPAAGGFWVRDADGAGRATEHVSFLQWERPSGEPSSLDGEKR